ncbi:MAG TPA: matrixin family metalloprotease, partial [Myxococcota bacterium]
PLDAWLHDTDALAITTVTFESNQGRLLDADVEVNDATFAFSACDPDQCQVQYDLQNTLTHEFGHVLGLDHTTVADATMFPSAPEGDTSKRDLSDDDIQAILLIYPAGQPAGECYDGVTRVDPPHVRFTPTICGAGGSAAPVLGLSVLLTLFARRRRGFSANLVDVDVGPADLPG